jgi:hypothetical protein
LYQGFATRGGAPVAITADMTCYSPSKPADFPSRLPTHRPTEHSQNQL